MTFLRLQRRTLRFLGFTLREDEPVAWKLYVLLHTSMLAAVVVPEMTFVIRNLDDVMLATNGMCTVMYCFMSLPKLVTMQWRRPIWYRLLATLETMWDEAKGEERRILRQFGRIDQTMSWVYSVSCYVAAFLYLAYPLARSNYQLYTTGNATWEMPMRSIFPYDIQRSPNFELSYLWFVQASYTAVFGSLATDTFYYGCAINLSAHLRVIRHQAAQLQYTGAGDLAAFRQLLRYHTDVLALCSQFVAIYVPIVFAQFLIASLQLCVVAYQLTLPFESYWTVAIFAVFLWAICYECFVYCHAGTNLLTESLAVADGAYASQWSETQCWATRRCVQFLMARAQKAVMVRGVFFHSNLVTFSSIMSTTGSYITLLQTLPN